MVYTVNGILLTILKIIKMRNKITRKDKKKLRAIMLCHTGNPACRKTTYGKEHWLRLKIMYKVWLSCFRMDDRKTANTVR